MATKKNLLDESPLLYGEGETPVDQETGGDTPQDSSSNTPQETGGDTPQDSSSNTPQDSSSNTPAEPTGDEPTQQDTEMTLQESIQAQLKRGSEIVDMGPNYKETYAEMVKDAAREAGAAQASNMQIATTVGARIPQVDTSEYAVRARFTANGKNAGENSDFAVKATGEGAGFKPTKDVKKNAFPEDGASYLEVVNTQSY